MRYAKKKEERRKYLRLRVYHLVKYQVISDKPPNPHPLLASIKDIGAGGICLVTEEPLSVSTNLQLEINFPDMGGVILTSGRVVWLKQVAKTNRYYVGIEFTGTDELLRKRIDGKVQFVNHKIKIKNIKIPKASQ